MLIWSQKGLIVQNKNLKIKLKLKKLL
jgi:hypothetical protein